MKYLDKSFSVPGPRTEFKLIYTDFALCSKGEWIQVGNGRKRYYPEGTLIPQELVEQSAQGHVVLKRLPPERPCSSTLDGHQCRQDRSHKGPHKCYECDEIVWINGRYL